LKKKCVKLEKKAKKKGHTKELGKPREKIPKTTCCLEWSALKLLRGECIILGVRVLIIIMFQLAPFSSGPRGCSGHGTCNQNSGKCQCDPLWNVLPSCSIRGCASNCTNGACVDGTCECNVGFSGPACEDFACENGCSGHGVCRYAALQFSQTCHLSPTQFLHTFSFPPQQSLNQMDVAHPISLQSGEPPGLGKRGRLGQKVGQIGRGSIFFPESLAC